MINRLTILTAFRLIGQEGGYSLWEHKNSDIAPIPVFRVNDSWSDEEVLKFTLGFVFVAGKIVERQQIKNSL